MEADLKDLVSELQRPSGRPKRRDFFAHWY